MHLRACSCSLWLLAQHPAEPLLFGEPQIFLSHHLTRKKLHSRIDLKGSNHRVLFKLSVMLQGRLRSSSTANGGFWAHCDKGGHRALHCRPTAVPYARW